MTQHDFDDITRRVLDAAARVHREVGPGLAASAYRACLAAELRRRRVRFRRNVRLSIDYDGRQVDSGYRLDFVVEGQVLVEVRSVAALDRTQVGRALRTLELGGYRSALLLNFNARHLGGRAVRRLVPGFPGQLIPLMPVPRLEAPPGEPVESSDRHATCPLCSAVARSPDTARERHGTGAEAGSDGDGTGRTGRGRGQAGEGGVAGSAHVPPTATGGYGNDGAGEAGRGA